MLQHSNLAVLRYVLQRMRLTIFGETIPQRLGTIPSTTERLGSTIVAAAATVFAQYLVVLGAARAQSGRCAIQLGKELGTSRRLFSFLGSMSMEQLRSRSVTGCHCPLRLRRSFDVNDTPGVEQRRR